MSEHEDLRPLGDIKTPEDLHILPRDEVERRAAKAHYWLDVAKDLKGVQDELVEDLEAAINALKVYQFWFATMIQANDPNITLVRNLLLKYKMGSSPEPSQAPGKVYADGTDITEHPDSIEGSEAISAELVQTKDGEFHWIINESEPEEADVVDDEPVKVLPPGSLDWLKDEGLNAPYYDGGVHTPTPAELEDFFANWENEGGSLPCDGE